jgi:hypothetical protein
VPATSLDDSIRLTMLAAIEDGSTPIAFRKE